MASGWPMGGSMKTLTTGWKGSGGGGGGGRGLAGATRTTTGSVTHPAARSARVIPLNNCKE